MRLWEHINHCVVRKKKSRDPCCDVSCISTYIQDGGQLKISGQNISRNKADIKIRNRLLYIVLESLSNETTKNFVAISTCTKYFRDDLMLCLCRSIGITFHRSFVQGYVCDSAIPVQLAS